MFALAVRERVGLQKADVSRERHPWHTQLSIYRRANEVFAIISVIWNDLAVVSQRRRIASLHLETPLRDRVGHRPHSIIYGAKRKASRRMISKTWLWGIPASVGKSIRTGSEQHNGATSLFQRSETSIPGLTKRIVKLRYIKPVVRDM